MIDAQLTIRRGTATRAVALGDFLDPSDEERAHDAEYRWIKSLRQLPVDGTTFRDRFTARGDSLWWFSELYLHKQRTVLDVHRTIFALRNLIDRESPSELNAAAASPLVAFITSAVAAAHRAAAPATVRTATWLKRLAALDARARTLTIAALATRDRWRSVSGGRSATVAAFVHRAFWRPGQDDGAAETYVGPVLAELERRCGAGAVRYVGVGPGRNFRTHRRFRSESSGSDAIVPVERFAPPSALADSRHLWRERYAHFRQLTHAPALREAACFEGIDCWPLLREELAGIAWLQWPWSVRAMDEAAAALEALRPKAVVTYAEAGGWGRALVLEARRRGIPSAGLQHGFIYRHWLNYRHEVDELQTTTTPGFPLPTRTLLFDEYAARHLTEAGSFPTDALRVTGSPRLEQLIAEVGGMSAGDLAACRQQLGAEPSQHIVLVAAKEREAARSLPAFLDAAGGRRDRLVIIKPHPAESAETYGEYLRERPHVRVASPPTSLARLLAVARVVVTVNSTVALDAGALGIPALSVGLPNNLSPFVAAGAIAGTHDPGEWPRLLDRILYDEGFRQELRDGREAVFGPQSGRRSDSAARAAHAVLELVRRESVVDERGVN
jgi:hypothetical protein